MITDKQADSGPVTVPLGDRSYEIRFYGDDAAMARDICPFCPEKALVVSNRTIWDKFGAPFLEALRSAGIDAEVFHIGDGERFKSLESTSAVYDHLIAGRYTRKSCVIAFGGGVVGDLAGFAAATFMRGVAFIQVPTTVVAMVDSSVGGKTGVDHPLGKNLVGAFHQPALVAVNPSYLDTLDDHNLRGGFAEVIKYGVIRDAAFFEWLEGNLPAALSLDRAAVEQVIRTSCRIKAEVVGEDEHENGLRAILNYGHTFGHAIESLGEYREKQYHGQAVAIGMACAADLAVDQGLMSESDALRIYELIRRAGLPLCVPKDLEPETVYERMFSDKKVSGGKIRFIIPRAIGRVELIDSIPKEAVLDVLKRRVG